MDIRKLETKDKIKMLQLMDEFWMKQHRGQLLSGEIKEIAELKNPLEQMIIELEQNGFVVFKTSAYINNTAALSLYRKLGFIDEAIELSRKVKK